jgi:hypothetical protein
MQKELIALFSRISVPGSKDAEQRFLKEAHAINLEASVEGYALSSAVIDALARSTPEDLGWFRQSLHETLSALTGSAVPHRALFNKFPYETPDHRDYFERRVIGYIQNATGQAGTSFKSLSCGHMVDERVFGDLANFSACPICQFQVDELTSSEEVRHDFKSITPFKVLDLADEAYVRDRAFGLLSRNSSLSLDERGFLRKAIDTGIFKTWNRPVPETMFREHLPFAYLLADRDVEYLRPLIKGATDILRIAAYLSKEDADLSLKEKTRFKVKTGDRKVLLDLLNGVPNPVEDMLRHRSEWLAFDKHVGFGTAKNRERYPQVWDALKLLREAPQSIPTFNRDIEKGIRSRKVDAAFLARLAERPGVFMRYIDFILRETPREQDAATLMVFGDVVKVATTESLIGLWKYLQFRGTYASDRVFVPKGMSNKMQIVQDGRKTIKRDRLEAARAVVEAEIVSRFAALPPLGKTFVDPSLANDIIPFNRRGDSSATVTYQKGSSYPIIDGPVIRLFVWWKGNIDVDLSAAFLDERMNSVAYCSFQNTKIAGVDIIHSGDVQNAPNGGSEFVDFEPKKLLDKGIRYVFPNIISYRSEKFSSFPCFAGYMVRDGLKSGMKFEPQSVEFKFDINSPTSKHLPFVFDLVDNRLIYLDLAGKGGRHQTIEGSPNLLKETLRVSKTLLERKPNYFDVVALHVKARGKLVETAADAERVIDKASLKDIDLLNLEDMQDLGRGLSH